MKKTAKKATALILGALMFWGDVFVAAAWAQTDDDPPLPEAPALPALPSAPAFPPLPVAPSLPLLPEPPAAAAPPAPSPAPLPALQSPPLPVAPSLPSVPSSAPPSRNNPPHLVRQDPFSGKINPADMPWVSDYHIPIPPMSTPPPPPMDYVVEKRADVTTVLTVIPSQFADMGHSPMMRERDPKTSAVHYVMLFFATAPFSPEMLREFKNQSPTLVKAASLSVAHPNIFKITFVDETVQMVPHRQGLNFVLRFTLPPKPKPAVRKAPPPRPRYGANEIIPLQSRMPVVLTYEIMDGRSNLQLLFTHFTGYDMVRRHKDDYRDAVTLKFPNTFYIRNMGDMRFDGRFLNLEEEGKNLILTVPREVKLTINNEGDGLLVTLDGPQRRDLLEGVTTFDPDRLRSIRFRIEKFLHEHTRPPFLPADVRIDQRDFSNSTPQSFSEAPAPEEAPPPPPPAAPPPSPAAPVVGESATTDNTVSVGPQAAQFSIRRTSSAAAPFDAAPSQAVETRIEEKAVQSAPQILPQTVSGEDSLGELVFNVPPPAAQIALFKQGEAYWLLFAGNTTQSLEDITRQATGILQLIRRYQTKTYTAFEIYPNAGYAPVVTKQGDRWFLRFHEGETREQVKELLVVEKALKDGAEYYISPMGGGRQIRFENPWTGQQQIVVTSPTIGFGNATLRSYSQFQIEPTIVGFLLTPKADRVGVAVTNNSIIINVHGAGISITGSLDEPENAGDGLNFTLADVPMENLMEEINKLTDRAAMATGVQSNIEMTNLARLYFSHGFFQETVATIMLLESDGDPYATSKEMTLMRGISEFYLSHYDEAKKYLEQPEIAETATASLWRSLLYAEQGDYRAATNILNHTSLAVNVYPPALRGDIIYRLGIIYTTTASINRTQDMYSLLTTFLEENPTIDMNVQRNYLHARLAQLQGKISEAQEFYEKTMMMGDLELEVKAHFDLVVMLYSNELLSIEDAIEQMDQLDFLWRGDAWSSRFFQQKVSLYMTLNRYREALETLRYLLNVFPDDPDAEQIAVSLSQIFESLFLSDEGDRLEPLEAIALYREFSELVPTGTRGDQLIERLVDYLVAANLLQQAEDVLSDQIQYRLEGEGAARVGARLAFVYLLHKKPAQAIEIINKTDIRNLPTALEKQRLFLRIQALMFLGNYNLAQNLLGDDQSEDATLLRIDIATKQEDWLNVVKYYRKVLQQENIHPRLTLEPLQAQYVLNMVAALVLMRNKEALRQIREDFIDSFSVTPYRSVFDLLTVEVDNAAFTVEKLNQVMEMLDSFQNFMHHYENRVRQSKLSFLN